MEAKTRVQKHIRLSTHYMENAFKFIDLREIEKAGEFFWGSMSQALKALAASKEIELRSHNAIRNYAHDLAKTLEDESIWHGFVSAQSLHNNFYETGLMLDDVVARADDIKKAVRRLLDLVPNEFKANGNG